MIQDTHGNTITITAGQVRLHLKGMKPRLVGTINDTTRTLHVKRIREKHFMRVNNSYLFNHHILANAKRFDKILLEDNYGQWEIPVKFILEHGSFLHFQKLGFEKQIFLHINYLNAYERKITVSSL